LVVPALFARLVDDAAVFPPGNAPLPEAVASHLAHRNAWYASLVGPLLVPASTVAAGRLNPLLTPDAFGPESRPPLPVGIVGDTGIAGVISAAASVPGTARLSQIEVAVAKRGEDSLPGLHELVAAGARVPGVEIYAEIPLTWGLLGALDVVAQARADGHRISPKFRTGGLAAELFPTPMELAAVICACRDRSLPFKLTAGLHRAIRHNDPETAFTHHGFLNVLAATMVAAAGAEVVEVAERLATTDPTILIETVRPGREAERPLWIGFGSCSVPEPVGDLRQLGLLPESASSGSP
jgi:hypothetical protein